MNRIARAWRALLGTDDEPAWRELFEKEQEHSAKLCAERDRLRHELELAGITQRYLECRLAEISKLANVQ